MAVCVLLPEAESWLAKQEEIELPRPAPLPVRNKSRAAHPIVLKERAFCEERMQTDRARADSYNHLERCAWCRIFRSVYPSFLRTL